MRNSKLSKVALPPAIPPVSSERMKEMVKQNPVFCYNGKSISAKKLIE